MDNFLELHRQAIAAGDLLLGVVSENGLQSTLSLR
jgi:hypothetical protein